MERKSIETVFRALNELEVRYLVAGGLAVLAHGAARLTQDIDLIVALEPDNAARALQALSRLDYRPLVPVALEDFARPELRQTWIEEKGAKVFQLVSEAHKTARVDLFLEEPFDFDATWSRAYWAEVAPGLRVSFVGLDDLIAMKEAAGRPQDLLDVTNLLRLQGR
ncbi:MAG: nucleotidyl transferase AbiEii/AbiGii toxin family protein [Thermoanaerobaculia bacterium]